MRILLTGGTGFVGKTFFDFLAETGRESAWHLTAISRDPNAFVRNNPALMDGLGNTVRMVQQTLPIITLSEPYDVIIHGAEVPAPHMTAVQAAEYQETLKSLLSFAKGCSCRRFIYLSSGAVYTLGSNLRPPFKPTIDIPCDRPQADPYALIKYQNEITVRQFAADHGIDHVIIRIFNVASRHVPLNGRYALGNFVRDSLDHNITAIRIKGSGRDRRSFIGSKALSQLIVYSVNHAESGSVFNACGQKSISIYDLAEMVRDISESGKEVFVENPDATASDYFGLQNLPEVCVAGLKGIRQDIADLICFNRAS